MTTEPMRKISVKLIGDYYESSGEDAIRLSNATGWSVKWHNDTPWAGFHRKHAAGYIERLTSLLIGVEIQ